MIGFVTPARCRATGGGGGGETNGGGVACGFIAQGPGGGTGPRGGAKGSVIGSWSSSGMGVWGVFTAPRCLRLM